jgi:hypothetical protein
MAVRTKDMAVQAILRLKPVANAAPYRGHALSNELASSSLFSSDILLVLQSR